MDRGRQTTDLSVRQMSEAPEFTVTADGQRQTVVSASFSEGPEVWKGYNFPYGDSRESTEPFEGARQIQTAFDEADVLFWWFDVQPPKTVNVEFGDRRYERLVSVDLQSSPVSAISGLIATAKVARV